MTPRTRTANKETDFKVYYSKKPPKKLQQRRFPTRRKIVRQRPGHAAQDVDMSGRRGGKRQLRFLPEMMRRGTVQDSEGEYEDEDEDNEDVDITREDEGETEVEIKEEEILQPQPMPKRRTNQTDAEKLTSSAKNGGKRGGKVVHEDDGEVLIQATTKKAPGRTKKRSSDVLQREYEEDEEPVQPTRKRRRTAAKGKTRESSSGGNDENVEKRPLRLRRQSTMTQMVDGRIPEPGSREPQFKPARRNSGKGKEGKKESTKDRKQQTLTQMVPGLGSFGIVSDSEGEDGEDVDHEESREYQEEMAEHLRAVFEPVDRQEKRLGMIQPTPQHRGLSVDAEEGDTRHVLEKSETHEEDNDDEAATDYEPTQDVQAPILNTRRTSKRLSSTLAPPSTNTKSTTRKSATTRFSLLSTPERRKVKFIPSSQSPPDSPLSTQSASPIKSARRSPLRSRSGNSDRLLDTPSKLRKVTFQEPEEPILAPPTLRKFRSVIQDSEDEGEGWSEDEIQPASGKRVGAETQVLVQGLETTGLTGDVGAETQAVLQQIDLACANTKEDAGSQSREPSQEVEVLPSGRPREVSQELGEEPPVDVVEDEAHVMEKGPDITAEDADMIKKEVDIFEEEASSPGAEALPSSPPIINSETAHAENSSAVPSQPRPTTQELIHGEDVSMFPTQGGLVLQEAAYEDEFVTESAPPELPFPATQYFEKESQPINAESYTSLPVQDTLKVDWNEPPSDLPSTPMVINDSDEEEEGSPTPQRLPSARPAVTSSIQHSMTDLDGEPIQVPRSPNPAGDSQHSYTSHSSKAEKQIQNEWLSHTQYFRSRAPHSSSMQGIQDGFSYQATPLPNKRNMAPPQSTAAAMFSQATTVDYTQSSPHTTPKKNISRAQFQPSLRKTPSKAQSHYKRSPHTTPKKTPQKSITHSQPVLSAHTTPHRPTSSSQDFVSPVRPPPLVIPSSFPSPGRMGMQWSSPLARSSPLLGNESVGGLYETQSVENFTMPPLPPLVIESSDVEDEEL
jgi:hypothetical protein